MIDFEIFAKSLKFLNFKFSCTLPCQQELFTDNSQFFVKENAFLVFFID